MLLRRGKPSLRSALARATFAVALLVPAFGFAQSAPSEPPPSTILLAPRMPDGGTYGAPATTNSDAAAPTETDASAPASETPPPADAGTSTPAESAPTPAENVPPLPPPPPGTLTGGVLAGLSLGAPLEQPARTSLMRARLRLLNSILPPLANRSSSGRIFDSVLYLLTGAGIGALGFFVPQPDMQPWFFALGGVSLVQGTLGLVWVPARERLSREFDQMPMQTARERRLRVEFGERAIDEIGADGARRRILGGIANSAVAVGMLALVYREPLFNGTPYTFSVFDAVVLGTTAISLATTIIQLASPSEDERLRASYRQQHRMLRMERGLPPDPPSR